MHIAIDSYFFFERDNFKILKDFFERKGISHELYKLTPFSHEINPPLANDNMIIPFGCIEFVQETLKQNENAFVFYDENVFTNENCLDRWGHLCLNYGAKIMTVEEAMSNLEKDRKYFMRPTEDLKSFTGNLFEVGHLPSLLERYGGYENNLFKATSKIVVSEPKEIRREWRNFIIDGKVVSSSLYKENGRHREELGAPSQIINLCDAALSVYNPAKAFVLDVCELKNGSYGIIEFGCIHNCGFYKVDVEKVLGEFLQLFQEKNV
jgi:hypothetical protein